MRQRGQQTFVKRCNAGDHNKRDLYAPFKRVALPLQPSRLRSVIAAHIRLTIRRRYSTIGPPAMRLELRIVMTHVHTSYLQHKLIQGVLHGFLHPKARSNI